jgi:ankyrin repeat protein
LEVVKELLSAQAAPDLKDENGGTPMSYAAASGHLKIQKFLEQEARRPADVQGCS